MKLADMKRTKAEKTARAKGYEPTSMAADDYPHGIHVEFDHDGLKKIGIDEMPKPGDEYHGEFRGRVTESERHESEGDAGPRRRVRMVMHHVGVEPKDEKPGGGLRDTIEKAAAKYENSPADKRADAAQAKKRGESAAKYENSAADKKADRREAAAAR